ncbi:LuxR family transcriptional regulator [Kitasatospora herbaricolor]|uniref:helix-turn-helix transcriptional regulator n=1 Tax=Kitasatospora herbaricolor TaxID=68217 RepID=UPI0019A63D8B|nr:LuxR family transcriptional regulator [Kitasatospora herbaricolor]MDQ0312609.1 DNA-binding CsgD family transcriptional regulator [Kitasatospora herbaricolor]GGV29645.1 LuxR family transcriptional regulator [Kitasatospora herbaricolor]
MTHAASGRGFACVGRGRELGLLLAALEIPPAVVLVEGEPGVGKSRLIQEATAALSDRRTRVVTGMCHPLREPLPFGPVLDALSGTGDWLPPPERLNPQAGALAPLLPALAHRLPPPPALPDDTRAGRFQLMGAVRSVLDAVSPLVLVVEDLHWADEATRELLLLLARDLPERLGVVLTYRREDLPADVPVLGVPYRRPPGTGGAEIHLGPLTEHDVHDLATAVLGPRASTTLSQTLFERSAGLPLIVEEDLLTLTTQPRPSRPKGVAPAAVDVSVLKEAEVPRGLREAVNERMATLSEPAVALVEAAAVLAVPADQSLLAEVAGLDPRRAGPPLTEALQAAVLREAAPGRYTFRHALARQTVHQDIPGPQRLDLHREAVRALMSRPSPPLVQIAHHTRALGDTAAWLRQAEAAADQAISLGDEGTASTLIHEILAQPRLEGDLRTRAALALSRIAVNGVDHTTSATALRRIVSAPRLPNAARGEIRLALGLLMVNQGGDAAVGERELERAIEELATRPDLAARAMVALAVNPNRTQQEAQAWMRRAQEAADDSPNRGARAAVHATRLTLMARANDPNVWDLVERLPRDDPDPEVLRQSARALFNVAYYGLAVGHDRRAEALLRESLDLARRLGTAALIESYSASQLLRLDWQAGRWDHLEADHTALLTQYPDTADIQMEAYLGRGYLAAVRGQWALALEQLRHAAHLGETALEPDCALRAAAGIAHVLLIRGEAQDAWAVIGSALDRRRREATWSRSALLLAVAVQAALASGRPQAAREIIAEAEQALEGEDAPAARSALAFAHGRLLQYDGDNAGAAAFFDRQRRIIADIGRPYYAARGLEETARTLTCADPHTAARHLTDAATTFAALGATADAARCQHTLRELGLDRPVPRGRRSYGDALSPRETQVAGLLATGATNKDIAQALSLSSRTVEHHVASVLKKLHTTRKDISDPRTAVANS